MQLKIIIFKIIKIQHGGYEGYVDQIPRYYEIEYASADYFFSWGWTDLVDKKDKLNMKILPMPSPWLSERKKNILIKLVTVITRKYSIYYGCPIKFETMTYLHQG